MWLPTCLAVAVFASLAITADFLLVREPFPGADGLVVIGRGPEPVDRRSANNTQLTLEEITQVQAKSGLKIAIVGSRDPQGPLASDPVRTQVSTNFFEVMGIRPAFGRVLDAGDESVADRAVIGDRLWRTAFGADRTVLGRKVLIGQTEVQIIGITPPGFSYPVGTDFWTPLEPAGLRLKYLAIARPPAAVSVSRLSQQLNGAAVTPLRDYSYPARAREFLVFLAAGTLLLVVVWIHVALAVATDSLRRFPEFRLRFALGASVWRVVGQTLVENLVPFFGCVLIASACAPVVLAWLTGQFSPSLFAGRNASLDLRAMTVLGVVAAIGTIVVVLSTSPFVVAAGRTFTRGSRSGFRSTGLSRTIVRYVVALQFATVTPILYLLFLAGYSYGALVSTNLGFEADSVFAIDLPPDSGFQLPGAMDKRLFQSFELLARIRDLPGVESAALSQARLGYRLRSSLRPVWLPDQNVEAATQAEELVVSGEYFSVLRIPVLFGKVFQSQTTIQPSGVLGLGEVVIDAALAKAIRLGPDAIGRRIFLGGSPATIVGVVGSIRVRRPDEVPQPRIYVNLVQLPLANHLLVRFGGSPVPIQVAAGRIVQDEFRMAALPTAVDLSEELDRLQADYRARFQLMSLSGWIAVILTASGIFGICAYTVARRQREVAIRLAVGATRSAILWICIRDAITGSLAGISVGVMVGVGLGREASRWLYAVKPESAWVFACVLIGLSVLAALGAAVPIRRAWRTDVLETLRLEQ